MSAESDALFKAVTNDSPDVEAVNKMLLDAFSQGGSCGVHALVKDAQAHERAYEKTVGFSLTSDTVNNVETLNVMRITHAYAGGSLDVAGIKEVPCKK